MFKPGEAKPGVRVTIDGDREGREYLVVDKHPSNGRVWLQDAETGRVGRDLHEHYKALRVVRDDYRGTEYIAISGHPPGHRPVRLPVRFRAGDWAVVPGGRKAWQVRHVPSGRGFGVEAEKARLGEAKDLAVRLAAEAPAFTEPDDLPREALAAVVATAQAA